MEKFDFSGWATRANIQCSDGRTILRDAFKECSGKSVPLVWNHQHNDAMNVLGHALLENREDGVYAYCSLNDTEQGRNAKLLVENGDITALSIYANKLQQAGSKVVHGAIREVSLVIAPANPGACIDSIICHGDESEEEAIIYSGEPLELSHGDGEKEKKDDAEKDKEKGMAEEKKTVQDVIDSMTEDQKTVMYAMIGEVMDSAGIELDEDGKIVEKKGGDDSMKHNVFENDNQENVLSHAEQLDLINEAKRYGSFRDYFLSHSAEYGIENIDYLFPEARTLNGIPEFIKRDTGWVDKILASVHHTPFSRIKSVFANITEDEARAKGYLKGNLKKEEVFALLKRTTTPTTVYKKQKLDRDDVVDITDFDVISWLKAEMRMMLNEELARAYLIGDGRLASSDDKINEQNIRPIVSDAELYSVKKKVTIGTSATDNDKATAFIKAVVKARKDYKGSGNPTLFTTEDMITNCLLLTDTTGRDLYTDEAQLAKKLRVKELVPVPPMENAKGAEGGALLGIMVNMADYNVGADKGGEVNLFDDFDIDYNQQKYLIETRCSGALVKPYSAIVFEQANA
nr:MAG TPA: major capsid protein [Caudoviricetes sp.]